MELSTIDRNALADSAFGLPHKRAYPMPDASQARNAKVGAIEEFDRDNLTSDEVAQIGRKDDKVLGEA